MTTAIIESNRTPSRETSPRLADLNTGIFERSRLALEAISEDRRPRFPPPMDDDFPEWMACRGEG